MNYNIILKKLEIKTTDHDVQRRATLLNILLLGIIICTAVMLLTITVLVNLTNYEGKAALASLMQPSFAFFWLCVFIFIVNVKWSPTLASILCLAVITIIPLLTFPYENIAWGWMTVFMITPIIMSSVILKPNSSFFLTGIILVLLFVMSLSTQVPFNYVSALTYVVIAIIAWLSASTLENTLRELRLVNKELDQRVAQRTQELVLTNKELGQARDRAIEASQYKSELTARVSHELRTPLGAILGFSEMLRGNFYGPTTERQREKLTTIINTTKQLSALIGDWLDQAKLEAGRLDLVLDTFSLKEFISEIDDIARILADQKYLSLTFNIDTSMPPTVYGDAGRLHQIVINLVSNAIKYTREGWIRVTISSPNPEQWMIEVKDSGIGIPIDAQPFIFESFNQVDSSRTRQQEGFGLGLSIVKQLVALMEGEIYLDSKPNVGSTFTVVLPLVSEFQEQPDNEKEFVA